MSKITVERNNDDMHHKSNIDSSNNTSSLMTENLPLVEPNVESYLLNGIIIARHLNLSNHKTLLSLYKDSFIYDATRLPTRKLSFRIKSQIGFNHYVPSKILITPFTVIVVVKTQDLYDITGTKFGIADGDQKADLKNIDNVQAHSIKVDEGG